MQPSRNLQIVVSHQALRKGLRRSLQQAHLKGEASLSRSLPCCFLICSLLCTVCPCIRAFGGITAAPRARPLDPPGSFWQNCVSALFDHRVLILKLVPQRNLNTKARLMKGGKGDNLSKARIKHPFFTSYRQGWGFRMGGHCSREHLPSKTPTMTQGLLAALSTLCLYLSAAVSEPSVMNFSALHCAMTLCAI